MSVKKIVLIVAILLVLAGVVAGTIYRSQSNVTKVVTGKAMSQELISVVSGTGHARISITELDQAANSQDPHRFVELTRADFDQVRRRRQRRVTDLAHRAVGAGHQHGAHALRGVARQNTARPDALVIRVSVNGHQSPALCYSHTRC